MNTPDISGAAERYHRIKARLEQPVDESKPLITPVRELMAEGIPFDEIFEFIFPPRPN